MIRTPGPAHTAPTQTVPTQTAPAPATAAPTLPAGTMPGRTMTRPGMPMMKLAVNIAPETQIAAVPGVGPKLAAAVVHARPFRNSADLIRRVKGIGPKNYVKLGLDRVFTS
ncbi:ComEA family DNA-binding protein [Deinococcus aquiradiocola]|nr:helix-hairpin-helix domain-containing protein [Deinococcus aquiradiocola]